MSTLTQMQRMKRARTMLLINHPFFGYLSAKLKLVETDQFPTMATDGRHMFFNPKFTEKLTDNQMLTGVGHETMHCASEHFDRAGTREQNRWKKACDHAINPILVDAGFSPINIPGVFDWLYDPKWKKNTAEGIYDQLPPEPPGGGGGCGCTIVPKPGGNDPGDEEGDKGTEADPKAPPVNWKRAIVEAASFAKMRGKLPAGIEDMVDKVINPEQNWRQIIRSAFSTAKKTDWTFRRPNKRYAHQGIVLPTPYGYSTSVEWWGDSSGSISPTAFAIGLGAAVQIANQFRITINAGVFDADVHLFEKNVRSSDILKRVKFVGRGGTAFEPVFEHIANGKRKPDAVVIWTDGYGSFPTKRPPYQVIWAMPDTSKEVQVPFGQRVFIDFNKLAKVGV